MDQNNGMITSEEKDSLINKKRKSIVSGVIICTILIIVISAVYILYSTQATGTQKNISALLTQQNKLSEDNVIPIPMSFSEVTIPYLRSRDYVSKLGELEKISENGSYTSYITSYDSDGLKVNGLLTIPNSSVSSGQEDDSGQVPPQRDPAVGGARMAGVKYPAIVFIHGYIPPKSYRTTVNYVSYIDYLARNGFVVFKIDLRGHDESEGEASGAYYSADYVIDTLNARAALSSSDFVDPEKIGLWGHSMGGNVVMRSMAVKPEIPAVVIWAGVVYSYTDQRKYGINDNSYRPTQASSQSANRRTKIRETYGEPSEDSLFWKQIAATSYLSDIKGAIQIHHALDDEAVDIRYSRDLMALLDKTSVVHQLFEYASGGHNLTGSSFTQAMQRTVEFYKEQL